MFKVIEDHKDFLLISKNSDVSFHKDQEQEGLAEAIRTKLGISELSTVHRLDKITSGLLLFAKNRETAKKLTIQFRKNVVRKYYIALSDRTPKKKQGLIQGDMEKARRGSWKLLRTNKNPAITQFFSKPAGSNLRLFLLRPYTGKTHQLRVALKSIGAPVLGDPLYHGKEAGGEEIDRAYLHAYAISFILNSKIYRFIHPPDTGRYFFDKKVISALDSYKEPWELKWPEVR
jgi:tRNA pseudouridine32 synthase/23S rRNA pseudouridine746 synthase